MNIRHLAPLALSSIALITSANAAISVTQNDVSNNTAWTSPSFSAGGTELYDERSLTINDAQGTTVEFIQIILDTTGNFDDSLALDIDADGTIDFISSENDAYNNPSTGSGTYTPWNDASPFTLSAIITKTGTTVKAYWDGIEIDAGVATGIAFNKSFTLQDWAGATNMNADGLILNNNFTSGVIRLGSLNEHGPSEHGLTFDLDTVVLKDSNGDFHTFDPDGDGVSSQAVPEPSSSALLLLGAGLGLARRKRRA